MKSIKNYIDEATQKVYAAAKADKAYTVLQESITELEAGGQVIEASDQVIEASDRKKKALKAAIKAVKDLFTLFGIEAPRLSYLMDVQSGLFKITQRWEYMNKNIDWL
ncbi:hypothetical protein [Sodaliphilus pleomorphus]|uniref:Uncharacterized protein n=1 Tax=Sodaliphilus pleomorphus TaxID=2606626 RepID=A0A6L5XDU9_9BACT|nr:hypothetical protein [Sodaliphilus pleomorphus]MSS16832.1 hypothetical protein [Sodaliphilus pleomorphus]